MANRRIPVALLATALLGGGVSALIGTANAAACPSFADAKGDEVGKVPVAGTAIAQAKDPHLDIVSASVSSDAASLTGHVTVAKLAATPAHHIGDFFEYGFKSGNGKTVRIYAQRYRDPINTPLDALPKANYWRTGAVVNGDDSYLPLTTKYDTAANTVSLTAKLADLDKLVGAPTAGTTITTLTAATQGDEIAVQFAYDTAAAPAALAYKVGTACTPASGGAPSPGPTEEEEGSPEPEESPTEEESPEPSESPTGE